MNTENEKKSLNTLQILFIADLAIGVITWLIIMILGDIDGDIAKAVLDIVIWVLLGSIFFFFVLVFIGWANKEDPHTTKKPPVILIGMRKEDVILKIGEPTTSSSINDVLGSVKGAYISSDVISQAMSAEHCLFRTTYGEYSIHFENGQVIKSNFIPK